VSLMAALLLHTQIYNLETEYLAAEYSQFGTVLKVRSSRYQALQHAGPATFITSTG